MPVISCNTFFFFLFLIWHILRRTCTGQELVEWMMDRCEFIQNRAIASKIWNIVLDLGILLSGTQTRLKQLL